MRIGIFGYYGFNNLGDELNLQCMMASLKEQYNDTEFLVFSDCRKIEGNVNYNIVGVNYFFSSDTTTKDIINSCDLLIIGGGGIIYLGGFWFPFMDDNIRVPYIIYRVGIDDRIVDINAVNQHKQLFLKAKEVTVRDSYSYNLCKEYFGKNVEIVPEAIWNHPYKYNRLNKTKGKNIGINLRNYSEEVYPMLKDFFTYLYNEGYHLFFVPCQVMEGNPNLNDNKYHRLVAPSGSFIVPDSWSIKDRCRLIFEMDMCIGMRLHFVLLSLSYKIPVIALNYNNKVKGLMEEVGLSSYIVDLKQDNLLNILVNSFKKMNNESQNIKPYLDNKVPIFEERARKFILR